jgi:hypothetical protein
MPTSDGCDEFPGRRGSDFVIPVASDPATGALEPDEREESDA